MTTVLQFSGGKDSLACLYLLKPQWAEITVAWLNTGETLPEVTEYMEGIRRLVPNFLEIRSELHITEKGWPVDLLPTGETVLGHLASGHWPKPPLFQSRWDCCAASIWEPMHKAMKELKATVIVRGQKLCDHLHTPVVDGQVVDGIEYRFPLVHWTDEQVETYLRAQGVLPVSGAFWANSSLDCWKCTAYLEESEEKLKYLRENHPEKFRVVHNVLNVLHETVQKDQQILKSVLRRGPIRKPLHLYKSNFKEA